MTNILPLKALLDRCTVVALDYCSTLETENTRDLSIWLSWRSAGQIDKNLHTRRNLAFSDIAETPDEYIRAVIRALHTEMPRWLALRQGDEDAWNQALRLIAQRIHAKLGWVRYYPHLNLTEMVKDYSHDIAEKVFRGLDSYPFDAALDAWITVIVGHHLNSIHRTRSFNLYLNTLSLDLPSDGAQSSPDWAERFGDRYAAEQFAQVELLTLIESSRPYLSRREHEVIRLLVLEALRPEEIAETMGISTGNVYQLVTKARKKLRIFREF